MQRRGYKGKFIGQKAEFTCIECGSVNIRPFARAKSAKYCKWDCYAKAQKGGKRPDNARKLRNGWNKKCKTCNEKFYVTPSRSKAKFCSRACKWGSMQTKEVITMGVAYRCPHCKKISTINVPKVKGKNKTDKLLCKLCYKYNNEV